MQPLTHLMRHRASRLAGAGVAAVAVAVGGVALAGPSASAASASKVVKVTYKFQVTAFGQSETTSGSTSVTTTAPTTVKPGATLSLKATAGSFTLDKSIDGVTINYVDNLTLKVKVPTNATFKSCTLTGGSGLGTGAVTCTHANGIVTISVPGPIPGGTTVTPPVVTFKVKAGKSGTITTKLAGTSYSSPGISGSANVSVFGQPVNATAVGYPSPNNALTTTKIS